MSDTLRSVPPAPSQKVPFGLRTIMELFDVGPAAALLALGGAIAVTALAAVAFFKSAPPKEITISSGPEGGNFYRNATKYSKALERYGVKVKILTSNGSLENLQRLQDPKSGVDVGFVQTGISDKADENLMSLGSIANQPLMIFYRGKPIELLSGMAGKRISIGPKGSGVNAVATALLAANGVKEGESFDLLDWEAEPAAKALLAKEIDAAFIMAESTPGGVLKNLLRSKDIHLFDFKQASAYTRKMDYLGILEFPQGSTDLGLNLPAKDTTLVGPMVELIAVKALHPALSDLLLEAAVQVHGRPRTFQKRGEFPAPIDHTIKISEDARRYYASGKSFLYRFLPFWLASLLSRLVVVVIPALVVLIPILKSIPSFFRWRVQLKIHKHYRELLSLEQSYLKETDPERQEELRLEFDRIEDKINQTKIRAAFADQFYGLRGHINYVRGLVIKKTG